MPAETESKRVYSVGELKKEKPAGEILLRSRAGDVHKVFICHGCQSCFLFTDDTFTEVTQDYPHFLRIE